MSSFSLDLEKFAKKAGANANAAVKLVALGMFARVTYRTPVDTGRARGNWQMTFNSPATSYNENLKDNSSIPATSPAETMEGEWRKTMGFAALQNWKSGDIWLTNNLPYINRLEYGWSKQQAPSGMVRITMREIQAVVNKAAKEVNK